MEYISGSKKSNAKKNSFEATRKKLKTLINIQKVSLSVFSPSWTKECSDLDITSN